MQRYNTLTPSIKKFELRGKAHHTVSWNMSRRNNEKLLIKWGGGGGVRGVRGGGAVCGRG